MNRRLLPFILMSVFTSGWAENALNVVTYNIHHGEGTDQRVDLDRIVAILQSCEPDVICLQEVDQHLSRTGRMDMPALLSAKLNMAIVFGNNYDFDGGHYGNATLTRLPVRESENVRLPGPAGVEPRGCLRVTVEAGTQLVDIYNSHFGLNPEERREQAAAVVEFVGGRPAILAGDLNARPEQPPIQVLLGVFHDSFGSVAAPDVPGPKRTSVNRIDYILITKDLRALSAGFVVTPETELASDHLPYVARIDLGRAPETLEDKGIHFNDDERLEDALLKETDDDPK